jgi:hypothetical protein
MGEIRRLLWDLVLRGERQATQILHWSGWRRWHQAWAAWHHTRRRTAAPPAVGERSPPSGTTWAANAAGATIPPAPADAAETVARVWARLQPLLPSSPRSGRRIVHNRRHILEAIVYVMQTDCGWNKLPSRFPPWKTVHNQYIAWRKTGIWDRIWAGITPPGPRLLE